MKDFNFIRIADICDVVRGGSPRPAGDLKFYNGNIPFLKVADITKDNEIFLRSYQHSIKEAGINKTRRISPNTLLLSNSGATLGVPKICMIHATINDGIAAFLNLDPRSNLFLYYFWLSKTRELRNINMGAAQPNLNTDLIKNYKVPYYSFERQSQIVSKIEELFSELDKGIQELKTAQQQLKVYRQAVLNSCIKDENLLTIESIIEKLDQGWSPKCYNESSKNVNEWAVIKTTAIQAGYFLDNENKRLPENLEPRKQHELKKGDILITRAGPRVRVGVCCMVKQTRPKLLNCDKVYRIRIRKNIALPEYVELILNSPKYSKEIDTMKTGISDSGVNLTQKGFFNILIPVPSIEEQQQIVLEIESRLSVCNKIEETITVSLKQAEALRQSILKKAFEGKLT